MITAPKQLLWKFRGFDWTLRSTWPDAATWHLTNGRDAIYLKASSVTRYPRSTDECARMRWASPYLPVPEVIDCGTVGDIDWLASRALPGVDATQPGWLAQPAVLTTLLATGLRQFHTAPTAACPFIFNIDKALDHVRKRVRDGAIQPAADFHPEHSSLNAAEALRELERLRPETENLVVCHGDYCLPNVLLGASEVSGFVDLGEIGIADRWWDLAVATWSLTWNLGPGWEDPFLSTYGVQRDDRRIAFFRLLYDLAS